MKEFPSIIGSGSQEAHYIEARSILSKLKSKDPFFGLTYNMNLYRGCQHACIYCDTRSECYGINDISRISVKQNAIELLQKELALKRKVKGTIGTGSMNDPYMPIEKELEITRKALEVIEGAKYPVHIITKSDLVVRDSDILQDVSKTYAAVSFTITTSNDELAGKLEPNAPLSSFRFKALKLLANKGIYAGITLMPIMPFINDTAENMREIVQKAKDAGASYIIMMPGVTLRKGSRDYLYKAFEKDFKGMELKYQSAFQEKYICNSPNHKLLYKTFYEETNKFHISDRMAFYTPMQEEQLFLF